MVSARKSASQFPFTFLRWFLLELSMLVMICFVFLNKSEARRAPGKRCISCEARVFEDFKQIRQQQILNELLKKLELTDKPNVTVDYDNLPPIGHNNSRIQALIDQTLNERRKRVRKSVVTASRQLQSLMRGNEARPGVDYFPALYETNPEETPQTSYVLAERDTSSWVNQALDGELVLFNFSPVLQSKYISKAVLNVLVYQQDLFEFNRVRPITVNVFQRFKNGSIGYLLATKADHITGKRRFVQLYLNPLDLQPWALFKEKKGFASNEKNTLGLYVQILDANGILINELDNEDEEFYRKPSMYIELETYDNNRAGRGRRSQNFCRVGNNQTGCCLYDLVIDFEKVGWEFVIAPKRYNAYICSGECDPLQMSKSPLGRVAIHANVDHFLCCHPKEYTGITIVYVDEGDQIWIREVPNMVARKCGCT